MIEAGFFDAGGVLHGEGMEDVHLDIIETLGLTPKVYYPVWDALHDPFGRGEITEEEFWNEIRRQTGTTSPLPEGESLFTRAYAKQFVPDEQVLDVVRRLKTNGYKVGLISNSFAPHVDFNIKVGIYDEFPVRVLSHEVGVRKPDPRIFQLALDLLQVKPEQAFYVDDREANVEAARKLGLAGIVFHHPEDLMQDLRDLGIAL
ncbi:HAD family phosphatase [Candidatus Roizmanbacteria bacterium]|nr:HAD family phosphatase [Candidatus Roizmanbacteria bacterium]